MAGIHARRKAACDLVGPFPLKPDVVTRGIHEGFEPCRRAAHVGGRAKKDRIRTFQRRPVDALQIRDIQQFGVFPGLAHGLGYQMGGLRDRT